MRKVSLAGRVRTAKLAVSVAVALATVAGALISPSPTPVVASGLCLLAIIALLWPANGLPILLLPAAYQWTVVAVKPIESAVEHVPLYVLASFGGDLDRASLFGLAGITVLAIGMRLGVGHSAGNMNKLLRQEAAAWPKAQFMKIVITTILLGHALDIASGFAGPARQILLALSSLRYAGLFALTYWCLTRKRGYAYLVTILAIEIISGMTGFFAEFRGAILTVAVAALCARPTLRMGNILTMAVVGTLILGVTVFWSAVKADYRDFVNLGTGAQVVSVPVSARVDYLSNALENFDEREFAYGFQRLVDRHSYIDFLANTLSYVPRTVPHENGARLGASLLHIVTPRILFPNKPPTPNDAQVTAYYTGLPTARDPNASISIGYLGEFYIDFGYAGALVCCLALGCLYGLAHRFVLAKGRGSRLFLHGLVVMPALLMIGFETALIKLIGGVVTSFAAAIVISLFVLPHLAPRIKTGARTNPALDGSKAQLL